LGVAVFLPFLFSIFSLFALIFKRDSKTLLSLESSYSFGVAFSFGALVALVFTISVKDIAFGWATTLNISASELSHFLNSIAIWKGFCSDCIVSEKLADISHFVRLGGAVKKEQIDSALLLGAWWKYLAMALITYGVIFRAILLFVVKVLQKGSKIQIIAQKNEEHLRDISSNYSNKISLDELKKRKFKLIKYHTNCNLASSDDADDIVVCVKSWEPPILDFFDYLEELKDKNSSSKISIFLQGLGDKAKKSDIDIWLRKLNELELNYEVIV